eukprot:SAG31_NODE_6821_length_1878_cov_1.327150_1_plen_58_part_10
MRARIEVYSRSPRATSAAGIFLRRGRVWLGGLIKRSLLQLVIWKRLHHTILIRNGERL